MERPIANLADSLQVSGAARSRELDAWCWMHGGMWKKLMS